MDLNRIPTVAEFMSEAPQTVESDVSLSEALERMSTAGIRHLIVTRAGWMIGMVSSRDILLTTTLPGVDPERTPISIAAKENPYACAVDTPVHVVARKMELHRHGSAIVMQDGKPVGVFTAVDAFRALRRLTAGDVEPDEHREVPSIASAVVG